MKENMDNICRTCLSTENELLLITSEIEDNYRVVDYFNECLNIKMNDNLPNKICLMCLDNLLEVRKFYKKCIESEKYLKTQINNKVIIKEENSNVIENIAISSANADNGYYDGGGGDDEEFIEYEMLEGSMNNSSNCGVTEDKKQNKLVVGFSCVECNEDFKYEKNYRLHLKIEHNINDFVLQDELHTNNDRNVATGATDKIKTIVQKPPSSSVVKNHKCEICNYAFRFLTNYDNHMRRHRPRKQNVLYKCPHNNCTKSFYSSNLLSSHVTSDHLSENNSLLCQYCGETSNTKIELNCHVNKYHQNHDLKRKFKCSFCESSFFHKNNLISHERRHTDERPFKCKFCDKTFRQRSALGTHTTLHTGKLIKCDLCDKRFSRKGILTVHMRSHTDERPYACPHCPQRYNQKCHLKSHLTSHSFERPYKCKVCGMTFAKKDIFRGHLFTHAPKPYKCPECSLETASVFWFRKHMKRAHNMENVDVKKYKRKIILNLDTLEKADVCVIAKT